MKVSARFNGQGLELVLEAEGEAEKRMVGAVLNQPHDSCWGETDLHCSLLSATVRFDGHFSNKVVDSLTLRVHRQEQPSDIHSPAGQPDGDRDE